MSRKQWRRMVMMSDEVWEVEALDLSKRLGVSRSALVRMGIRAMTQLAQGEEPKLRILVQEEGGDLADA